MQRPFCVSLALSQKQDHSAVGVLERAMWSPRDRRWLYISEQDNAQTIAYLRAQSDPDNDSAAVAPLRLLHIARWPRATTFPHIVADVTRLLDRLTEHNKEDVRFLIDATTVGQPIVDLFKRKRTLPQPVAITISGGTEVIQRGLNDLVVPKRDIVMAAVAAVETGRVAWPAALPQRELLESELRNFTLTYSASGSGDDLFALDRREHDDLILALGMGLWYVTQYGPSHQIRGRVVRIPTGSLPWMS